MPNSDGIDNKPLFRGSFSSCTMPSGGSSRASESSEMAAELQQGLPGILGGLKERQVIANAARMLRHVRKSTGVSQVDLANLLGKQQPAIARLESVRAERGPRIETLANFLDTCGYDLVIDAVPRDREVESIPENARVVDLWRNMLINSLSSVDVSCLVVDKADRIVEVNKRWQELNPGLEKYFKTGTLYSDYLKAGIDKGHFPGAKDDSDWWLDWRLSRHLQPIEAFDLPRQNGIILSVKEARLPEGEIVTLSTDVTQMRKLSSILEIMNDAN